LRLVEVFERILRDDKGDAEYHYVLIDFLCREVGGQEQAGDDADEIQWFNQSQLDQLELTEGTLPVIQRAFDISRNLESWKPLGIPTSRAV
jgi:ADP-ribose pyrophosphatase YjhB (NUDIX family)